MPLWQRRTDEVLGSSLLAVSEKILGLPFFLDFLDRCANACSLYPLPAALTGPPACGARNGRCSLSLAPFRPLRQPLLAVSATGGARRRCPFCLWDQTLVARRAYRADPPGPNTDTPEGVSVIFCPAKTPGCAGGSKRVRPMGMTKNSF